ncbi:MAG: sigma-70 family RNA polymerase sigma factor [Armatimonadetes bacterium]|nr:sigma-70 family RNA polymerase sigma factor [Armatimonadota bacterium]
MLAIRNPLSPEASLVARTRRGDAGAFEALVRQHKDSVLNLARRMVADCDAAEDIAQEAFIKAYRELHRFRGESAFATWLYRITINEARLYLRGHQRRVARWERQRDLAAAEASAQSPTDDPAPLTELLQELSADQREALALFHLKELSLEEIARTLGAPLGTVKARLSRGRERLRQLARERGLA